MSGFDGNGNFFFTFNWVNDAANGIPITASRMDGQFNDAVSGFDLCLTRDGQGSAQADLPMNGHKFTGVGNATATDQFATLGQLQAGSSNTTTSGYITLPTGTIVQWGRDNTVGTNVNVTLPLTFPTLCVAAFATLNSSAAAAVSANVVSTSVINLQKATTSFAFWLAIGY